MLCESIPLVFQQARVFEEETELSIGKYCGETCIFNWDHELATKQVLVLTAGLFMNLLQQGEIRIPEI